MLLMSAIASGLGLGSMYGLMAPALPDAMPCPAR